ncbi:hypothetical protein [Streptomyces roseoverticillatus]|uniref:Uncharacterized protein n=1 Tax=Streptomyces roseoverticillatus TaxID=66429 RepID=A0ABV3IMX2_9ACTN
MLYPEYYRWQRRRAGRLPVHERAAAKIGKVVGAFLVFIAWLFIAAWRKLQESAFDDLWRFALYCASIFLAILFMILGYIFLWKNQKRLLTPTMLVEEGVSGVPGIPFVLYLRSFDVDEGAGESLGGAAGFSKSLNPNSHFFTTRRTQEQQLVRALYLCTGWAVVAFGHPAHPDEQALGADRLYYLPKDDRWKDAVTKLIHKAECVVLTTGETGSLEWEYRHVMADVDPKRATVLVTGGGAEYERFRSFSESQGWFGGKSLPKSVLNLKEKAACVIRGVLRFGDDWTGAFVPIMIMSSGNGGCSRLSPRSKSA